jgi:hypothetical protein
LGFTSEDIFGKLPGEGTAVLCGSHLNTIVNGGIYDGALGVLTALECLRVIKENGIQTKSPIEVVSFTDLQAIENGAMVLLRALIQLAN